MRRVQSRLSVVLALTSAFMMLATTTCAQLRVKPDVATRFECVSVPAVGTPVRVMDAEGRPVAGAFVTWFEELPEDLRGLPPEPQLGELRRTLGKTVLTNSNGETRVDRYESIVASSGTNYAA